MACTNMFAALLGIMWKGTYLQKRWELFSFLSLSRKCPKDLPLCIGLELDYMDIAKPVVAAKTLLLMFSLFRASAGVADETQRSLSQIGKVHFRHLKKNLGYIGRLYK